VEWLAASAGYVLLHLSLFLLAFRKLPAFAREGVVFAYHFGSALALLTVTVLLVPTGAWPAAWAAIGLHGLYSLSFLELWSLAEGSYTLAILGRVEALGATGLLESAQLVSLGEAKRRARVQDLQRLRVVRCNPDGLRLTAWGRLIAAVLAGVAWIANVKRMN
jgi:hypothetical protein